MYYPVNKGGERHAKEISERLAARGHEVTVVTTNTNSGHDLFIGVDAELQEIESFNGVKIVRIPAADGALPRILEFGLRLKGGYRSLNSLLTPAGLEVLSRPPRNLGILRSILRSDADLVVAWNWYWPPAYQAYLAKSLKRFRLVGIPFFHTEESWVQQPVYETMIAACDALVVNSSHEKEYILSRVPGAHRIVVLGAGVDPDHFAHQDGHAFRSRHELGSAPLVCFVGSLCVNKGIDKIVDAMPVVWNWNEGVRLVIAGFSDGPNPALDHALTRLDWRGRERVLIIPNIAESDKLNLYDASDVFVMPSVGESFGISYLESWMCRKPVIGAKIGSTACVIEDGNDGVLVEPQDSCGIGRAIIELLADPDRRSRMGQRGYAKAMKQFTWDKICDGIEGLFLELIGEKSVPCPWPWQRSSSCQAIVPRNRPTL
jgi:glycosyltransferase involved in cell wall biosynthesis